jgi:hypothetical protein
LLFPRRVHPPSLPRWLCQSSCDTETRISADKRKPVGRMVVAGTTMSLHLVTPKGRAGRVWFGWWVVATGAAAAGTHARWPRPPRGQQEGGKKRQCEAAPVGRWYERTKSTHFLFFFLAPDAARSRRWQRTGQCTRDRTAPGDPPPGPPLTAPTSRVYGGVRARRGKAAPGA